MSMIRKFASMFGHPGVGRAHVVSGASTLRAAGEAGITGLGLGYAHAMLPLGLDIDGKVPLDGAIAALGLLGGVGMAHESFGEDLKNVGLAAGTIYAFRQGYRFSAAKKMANTDVPPEQRIPGDRIQEQNVAMRASNKAAGKMAGEYVSAFGAEGSSVASAVDPILEASRLL